MAKVTVTEVVEKLKGSGNARFSQDDYKTLAYAVLSDKEFKAKKYLFKNDELEADVSYVEEMGKFLDKLLKHAGIMDKTERESVISSFEFTANDVEWVTEVSDTINHIYLDCGKSLRMFRKELSQLTIKRIKRTGKYEGRDGYKKTINDRTAAYAAAKTKSESK